jgi:hypothetical protein
MSPNRPVGPAARIARVAECGHGNSAHGRYRAESQSEPTLFVQGPPILPSHVPAPSPGNGPDYLSLGRSIGSNAIGRMVGDTAKLTKRSPRRHRQRRLRTVPAAIFTAPLRRSLSNYRRLLTPCRHKTVGVRRTEFMECPAGLALFASLAPDARRLDDRPPLLDLGLVEVTKCFGRLLRRRRNFLPQLNVTFADV